MIDTHYCIVCRSLWDNGFRWILSQPLTKSFGAEYDLRQKIWVKLRQSYFAPRRAK
jgi:hypothetical protein